MKWWELLIYPQLNYHCCVGLPYDQVLTRKTKTDYLEDKD